MRNLQAWLSYLESIHPTSIDMGLTRVAEVAKRLAFDWSEMTVVTVGGTNGKGTTCCFMENVLLQMGNTVATYRSPHLVDYRERITFNGKMHDEVEYTQAFQQVQQARGDISLTYFEFGTLAAMVMMQRWAPDFVLLEVGLGGRLDATNIVDSDCAVITSIGLDHQSYLGNTRAEIATEKAGIFRTNKPVVIGESDPPEQLRAAGQALDCNMQFAGNSFGFKRNKQNDSWSWRCNNTEFAGLPLPKIPIQNASTALAALSVLGVQVTTEQVIQACAKARLPGRRQIVHQQPTVLLDVAHNPQAASDLAEMIARDYAGKKLYLVAGMLQDKDCTSTLACFAHLQPNWMLTNLDGERGRSASELAKYLPAQSEYSLHGSVGSALSMALQSAQNDDFIVVFGSFLTVAEVLAYDFSVNPARRVE